MWKQKNKCIPLRLMDAKITLLLIIANAIISILGFSNQTFLERYLFNVGDIQRKKQYERLLTSGFLHVDFMHLTFNMFTLYFFGSFLETRIQLPAYQYIIIYFASLLAGNILAYFLNKNKPNYSAVGASGAVSGILFATIAMKPDLTLGIFFIIPMPAWLYGIGFILFSIYGIKNKSGNIGHEAHLGGALLGVLSMVAFYPELLERNYWVILGTTIPAILFLFISFKYPHLLQFSFKNKWKRKTEIELDDEYLNRRQNEKDELNRILEKINSDGFHSLNDQEKEFLKSISNK